MIISKQEKTVKKTVTIPYGRKEHLSVEVPEENLIGIFKPKANKPLMNEEEVIQEALLKPVGTLPLNRLAIGKKSAAIAITDASRPNIERKVLPFIIQNLESAGLTKKDIKIIIGGGSHRTPYENEIEEKIGSLKDKVEIIFHNVSESEIKNYGNTADGYPIEINRYFAESEAH